MTRRNRCLCVMLAVTMLSLSGCMAFKRAYVWTHDLIDETTGITNQVDGVAK